MAVEVIPMAGKEIPDFREAGLNGHFANKVARRQEIKARITELQADLAEVNVALQDAMVDAGQKNVRAGNFTITLVEGQSTSISKERLLEQGVPAKVIEKATKVTEYVTVQVTERKEK